MASGAAKVLVQGASRGLGLQFCRSLLIRHSDIGIIATCRAPDQASELQALKMEPANTNRLHVLKVNVTEEEQIQVGFGNI